MRLLLDTHVLLWALVQPRLLSVSARQLIGDGRNQVNASVVSLFEIANKRTPPRRTSPIASAAEVADLLEQGGYSAVPLTVAHAVAAEGLAPSHPDPFDRLLLAQAITERMHFLSHDEALGSYGELVIVV